MVEWKKLGEVCTIIRGNRVTKSDLIENGKYPVISGGVSPLGYIDKYNREPGTITIAQYGSAGYVDMQVEKFWANDVCYSIYPKEGIINKFLYYTLKKDQIYIYSLRTNAVPAHLPQKELAGISIPIPSLSEQERIVGILDTFTAAIENLKAQISLRRKQYEHYRDKLLDLEGKEGVEMKTLGEVFPYIRNGFVGTVTPFFTNKENGIRYLEGTNIHNGTISDNIELYVTFDFHRKHIKNELKADDILMVQSGHIGDCAVVGEKYKGANCHALIIMSNGGNSNSKYFVHYFHTGKGFKSLAPAITGGTIKHVLARKVDKVIIPVPSLEEQSRIVSILDTFEASIANLEAQLREREKQYEYYRNKLLSF